VGLHVVNIAAKATSFRNFDFSSYSVMGLMKKQVGRVVLRPGKVLGHGPAGCLWRFALCTFPVFIAEHLNRRSLACQQNSERFSFFFRAPDLNLLFLNHWSPVRRWGGGVRGRPRLGFQGIRSPEIESEARRFSAFPHSRAVAACFFKPPT